MSIQGDITILIDRLKRANIPMEHLCYELDENEWQAFCRELEAMHIDYASGERDYSYVENMRFMGMPIRKRTSTSAAEPK